MQADYYQILGVLPDAEQVVITAAYRALASQYHPDRWAGDKAEATRRMAEINVAYSVLGDTEKRAAYDKEQRNVHGKFDETTEQADQAFDSAGSDFEDRWATACTVYPDLLVIRKSLAKISHALAFAFVVNLVENKNFKLRNEIAAAMQKKFMERHFGTNPEIIAYAHRLIQSGFRDAIKKLNSMVDVLGSDVDAQRVIERVELDLNLKRRRDEQHRQDLEAANLNALRRRVIYQPLSSETFDYAKLIGYEIDVQKGGFFYPDNFSIRQKGGPVLFSTTSHSQMCVWIKNNLL
jgi:curved DNA-binding protein CbpA